MKFLYRIFWIFIALIISASISAQVNIYNLGSEILVKKNTILTINGNLQNEDSVFYNLGVITISGDIVNNAHHLFPDDNNGSVIFTGDSVQYIRGSGNTVWFNVLRTQSSDTIKLQLPINVFDSLSMEGGYILLNGKEINLDNSSSIHAMGFLHGESNSSKIIGDTGYIKVKYLALQPITQNLAGIGVTMNSSGNFGTSTIKRYHQEQQILDESINKVYKFDFSNPNNANVHIDYLDNDYNPDSLKESDFIIWKSTDLGSNWNKMGGNVNTSANNVDVLGISMEDSWLTVAPKNCRDVPPVNIGDGDSTMICIGDTIELIAGDHLNGYTYQWHNGSADSSFTTTEQGLYYVKVTNPRGCYTIDTTVVMYYPEAHASFSVGNICEKDSTWFQNQSYVIGDLITAFHWDFGNGDTSNLITAFEVFDTAGTYDVNLRATTYSGCSDDTTVHLTAYARPVVGFWDTIVCDNLEITFHDTSSIVSPYGIMSRSWTFDNIATSIAQDTTVKFGSAGSYVISLVDEANTGCKDSVSKTITINENSIASFTTTDVCIGETTDFTNTSNFTGAGLLYKYYFDDNDSSSIENPSHTYNSVGVHNDTLVVFYNSGQCSDTANNTNEIFAEPFIDFGGSISSCDSYTLDAQNAGCTYLWSDGSTAQTLIVTTSGNYSVTITNTTNCNYSDAVSMTIFTSPTPDLGVDTSVCASLQLDAGYNGSSYQWSSGQSSQTINATSTNSYSVTVTDANTCSGIDTILVTVNPFPNADFSITDVCLNQSSDFANQSTISTGTIASYSWDFGDGINSNNENPSHVFGNDISYNIQLSIVSDSGCADDITKSTSIRPLPSVGFTSSYLCDKQEINFSDTSIIESPYTISSRQWDFDDGQNSTAQNPSNIYTLAGNYNIKLQATTSFGCSDSIIKNISVNPSDSLSFDASNVCLNDTTMLNNTSSYSESNLSWSWNFGDNNIASDSTTQHYYSSVGSYDVSLVVNYQNGQCYDTLIKTTQVMQHPVADLGTDKSSCNIYTLNAQNDGSTYLWNDGSTNQTLTVGNSGDYSVTVAIGSCNDVDTVHITINQNPTPNLGNDTSVCESYVLDAGYGGSNFIWSTGETTQTITVTNTDTYTITVSDANGCDGTDSITVSINPFPVANYSIADVCLGQNSSFTNSSSVSSGSITNYQWTFGNDSNSVLQNPSQIYGEATTYSIKLLVTTNAACSDSITKTTSIKPLPIIGFTSSYNCDKQEISFNDTSSVINPYSIASREWNFDNGQSSSAENPIINFTIAANYDIKLMANTSFGCSDSTIKTIFVEATDSLSFNATDVCLNTVSQFDNTSTYSESNLDWKWNFGDNSISSDSTVQHQYSSSGNYDVSLVVNYHNGQCYDTLIKSTEVFANPVVDLGNSHTACGSYTADAQNIGSTYLWNNGSTNQTLTAISTGDYSVTVSNTNGCQATDTVSITINQNPNPNLGNDTTVCGYYVLNAGNANSYQWNSGENTQNITVNSTGVYIVTVSNIYGCSGVDSASVTINPFPTADFSVNDVCLGQNSDFNNLSSVNTGSIQSNIWNFGDQNSSSIKDPSHIFGDDMSYNIKLKITSDAGCSDSITKSTNIKPLPIIGFTTSYICDKQVITFNDTSSVSNPYSIASRSWDFDNGQNSTAQNPIISFNNAANYDVKLIATSSFGCSDSTTKTINVQPTDSLSFNASDVCLHESTIFNNTSSYTETNLNWSWDFGDNSISSDSSTNHQYSDIGNYNISLIVTYGNGQCTDTLVQSTEVFDNPNISFGDTITTCGASYTLDAQNTGSTYLWNDNSNLQQFTANTNGDYSVTITNSNSCSFVDSVYIGLNTTLSPNIGPDTSSCGIYTLDANYSGSTYSWNTGENTQTIDADTTGLYKVTITDANGCIGSDSVNIQINPIPVASFSTQNTCLNTNSQFQNTSAISTGSIISYLYDFDDNTSSNIANPDHLFANSGNYQVNLQITSDSGCVKDTNIIHKIYSLPQAGFSSSTLCSNFEVSFHDTSMVSNAYSISSYKWNFDNGISSIAQDTTVSYTNTGSYNIGLEVTSNVGCKDTAINTIIINNNDTVGFAVNNVCAYDSSAFSNTSTLTGAIQWNWTFGNGNSSTLFSPKELYSTSGNYSVQLIATHHNGQCSDTFAINTEVYEIPQINFSDTLESCETTYIIDAQNTGSSYIWNNNSTNQTLNTTQEGEYWVKVINQNSCENSDTTYVIFLSPVIVNLGSDTSLCTIIQIDAANPNAAFSWNTGANTRQIIADTSGLYKVDVTDINGCIGMDSINIYINPVPIAAFTTQSSCLNTESVFQNTSTISSGSLNSFLYDFGDNTSSNIENATHSYSSATDYQVKLTVTSDSGCVNDTIIIHTVYGLPIAGFSTSVLCDNFELSFHDTTSISNAYTIDDYSWDFDNGNTSLAQDTTVKFANTGNYNIQHIAISNMGCSDTVVNTIMINPNDTIGFTASDVCLHDTTFFNNTSSLTGAVQWDWQFDNGNTSSIKNPSQLYSTANIFAVELIASYNNGHCIDTFVQNIVVDTIPEINFATNIYTCDVNYIIDAQNNGASYTWSDNSTNQTLVVSTAGTYYVEVSLNGCTNSDTTTVNFKTPALINLGSDTSYCGNTLLDAENSGSSYSWNTGAASQTISVDTSGLYIVDVVRTNGCTASDSVNIHINPIPIASFTTQNSCLNVASSFQNTSSISVGNIASFIYDFGDNNTSTLENPTHIFGSDGNYQISLQITSDSACVKDTSIIHTVYGIPSAGFSNSTICDNFEVSFTDTSLISNAWTITNWEWDFNNSVSSQHQDTTVVFDTLGNYNISLITTSNVGCSDTVITNMSIVPNDSVNFFMANICVFDTAFFNNTSNFSGVTQWQWSFGNGNASTLENTKQYYATSGNYPVKLKATYNNGQCLDSLTKNIDIYQLPQINFTDTIETCLSSYTLDAQNAGSYYLWSDFTTNQTLLTNNSGMYYVEVTDGNNCKNSDTTQLIFNAPPNPNLGLDTSACGSYSLDAGNGASYNWSSGETTQQLSVTQTGSYWVEVTTTAGCVGSDTVDLVIFTLPTVYLGNDVDTCNVDSLQLSAGSFDKYIWSNSDTISNIYAKQTGSYWVQVTDTNSCNSTDTIDITLQYLNQINISDSLFICPGEDLVVNPHATGATVNWLGPNGFSQTADSVTISNTGTYFIEANLLSCTERDTFEVAISNLAMITEYLSASEVETQDSVLFIELSHPDPIHFLWNFDDGVTDTLANAIHLFYIEGTYNVSLTAYNSQCSATLSKPIVVTDPAKEISGDTIRKIDEEISQPELVRIVNANLYPNPNNGQFTLNVELSTTSSMQVAVFDLTGKMIYLKDYNQSDRINQGFNFQDVSTGYYLLVVKTINESRTFKIVVVK